MILDKIENAHVYKSLHPGIRQAFDFIQKTDFSNFLPGKYPIDGEDIFVLVNEYETKNALEGYPEAHQKYIDIQIMISGSERFGYAPQNRQKEIEKYNEKKDIAFFDSKLDFFELKQGMFAIFFNNELHQPGNFIHKPESVKKVVAKVFANYSDKL